MRKIIISMEEAGQRLDKAAGKYLPEAPMGFIYKMIRKKNITLNGKRASGNEKLSPGDSVKFWLSDETIEKFRPAAASDRAARSSSASSGPRKSLSVIYEDSDLLFINKPAGVLSQKAEADDFSLNEMLQEYLISNGALTEAQLDLLRPSVCNRLDRNTSGLITAGKSIRGLKFLTAGFRDRSFSKYYLCLVKGEVKAPAKIEGYLSKDQGTNTAVITESGDHSSRKIETCYTPVFTGKLPETLPACRRYLEKHPSEGCLTLLKVHLITGRTHQIRAHLASAGYPVAGDLKYGDEDLNRCLRDCAGVRRQLLHSSELVMPDLSGEWEYLSGRSFSAPVPKDFYKALELIGGSDKCLHGIPEASGDPSSRK
ncbi:MAG: RluA family pseudouridine synthase [Lachnospiraceae bacterium]|nr:RluA family pseudouridine synthase [Lachnospiraceae bacterium]